MGEEKQWKIEKKKGKYGLNRIAKWNRRTILCFNAVDVSVHESTVTTRVKEPRIITIIWSLHSPSVSAALSQLTRALFMRRFHYSVIYFHLFRMVIIVSVVRLMLFFRSHFVQCYSIVTSECSDLLLFVSFNFLFCFNFFLSFQSFTLSDDLRPSVQSRTELSNRKTQRTKQTVRWIQTLNLLKSWMWRRVHSSNSRCNALDFYFSCFRCNCESTITASVHIQPQTKVLNNF